MKNYDYINSFKKLGFGIFVHFGLYSVIGKGEWAKELLRIPDAEYDSLKNRFNPDKDWAQKLVSAAKNAGAKYITLTTRHHDGFSLYDTLGLGDYDAVHSAAERDLIHEFTDECNRQDIVPFFYHTLLDWHNPDYRNDFSAYIDYLVKSVEILCTRYGKIGGFWFDGMWDKWDENWQEDRLYGVIRHYQPEAMIINNTGLEKRGLVSHNEIDSVTFERGAPVKPISSRPLAGEMCQILADHWGYAQDDINYKPLKEILTNLIECRANDCNFLLNVGPTANGTLCTMDSAMLENIGKWVSANGNFIYRARRSELTSDKAIILEDSEGFYYAVVNDIPNSYCVNLNEYSKTSVISLNTDKTITDAIWLDTDEIAFAEKNTFIPMPFLYGVNLCLRVMKFRLKDQNA